MLFPFIFICFFLLPLNPILQFQQSSISFPLSYPLFSFVLFPCFPYIVFYFNVLSFFSLILSSFSFILFPYFPIFSHIFPYIVFYFPFPFSFFNKENYQFLSLKWYTFIFGVFFISIYNL